MENKNLSFSYSDFLKTNWKTILIIITCSIFYSFGVINFLSKASLIPSGLSSISITIVYINPSLTPYLNLIYLALNIPLIIFFWNKLKRKFILLTIIFLLCNACFGYLFGFNPIKNFFSTKVFVFIDDAFSPAIHDGGYFVNNLVYQGWPIFIYLILALVFCGPASAMIWKFGASTGGTDVIAHYFSTKRKKDVGLFLMLVGYIMAFLSLLLIFSLKNWGPKHIQDQINGFRYLFGVQTVASFVYIFAYGKIINMFYPKYKKVLLKIDTKQHENIIKWLEKSEYWHPYKITDSVSGYTKLKNHSIETIVLLLESDDIIKKIKIVDPEAWISVSPVSKIYGRFNYSFVE